jgi:hypothetical protein
MMSYNIEKKITFALPWLRKYKCAIKKWSPLQ